MGNDSLDPASRMLNPPLTLMSHHILNRRDFITFSAMATAMLGLSSCVGISSQATPRKPRPIAAGAKVRVAQIGCGGKGYSDIMAHKTEEVVALCDIDWEGPPEPRSAKGGKAGKDGKAAKEPYKSQVKKLMD